ncbi:tandem-95 repeat protein [Legionella worsleiensis]|uniref:tandem-95 repeat protein n=1 Tax=Legionella worsleiensis TaxID=45076 RepID=UPI0012ED2A51
MLTGTSSVDGAVSVTEFSVAGDPATYLAGDTAVIAGVGSLLINADGAFSFVPAANYNGAVPVVTYTMTDGSSSDTSTLSLDVTAVDDAFSDNNEVLSTVEDTPLNGTVLSGTSSVDGSVTVTQFSVAGDPATYLAGDTAVIAGIGSLQINADGTFSFTPDANYNGAVPVVTYTLTDGSSTDTSTLSLDVTPVNDPLVDSNEVLSTPEDTPLNGTVLSGTSSPEGAVIVTQFSVAGDLATYLAGDTAIITGIGSLQINADGTFSFTPNANYNGAVPLVTYSLTDGSTSDTSTLSLDVTAVDDAFTDNNEVLSIVEDAPPLNGTVLSGTSSVDGPVNVTQFSVAGDPATYLAGDTAVIAGVGSLLINADGTFIFTPNANYNGTVPLVTYTLSDGSSTDTSTLALDVTPVDDSFSDSNEVLNTAEDTPLNGTVLSGTSSVDGPVTVTEFSVAGDPATYVAGDTAILSGVGTLQINTDGTFSFIPNSNYNGAVPLVTYTLSDGSNTDVSTLTISLTAVNDAPIITGQLNQTMVEDGSRNFRIANSNEFTLSDTDSASVTITISVLYGNLTVSDSIATTQGIAVSNNGSMSITLVGAPANMTTLLESLNYTPVKDYYGQDTLTFTANDGVSSSTHVTLINITAGVDIADDTAVTNEDTAVNIAVIANDTFENAGRVITAINGNAITVGGTVNVADGTVLLNANGTVTFTPANNFNGSTSFTYTVTSGGATETATVNVTVNPVSDAPQGSDYTLSATEDTPIVLSTAHFSMTDVNDNPANSLLRVRIATLPTSGTLTLNGVAVTAGQNIDATDINAGLLVFTPVKDAHGASTFTFQVSDDGGTANGGVNLDQTPNLFTIDVGAVADTPLVYAHLSLPTITAGTNVIDANFSDNINENNLTNWTRVALFTNTFAEIQGGSGKSQTEANLFTSSAWAGQTGTDATEVSNFNSRWTKSGGEIFYNSANANDDSQGILFLNTNQMTVAERALTSYVISVDVFANINTSVNGVGVVFGYQNSSNYFLVRWENPDINFAPGGSSFQFLPGQYYELSLVQIVAGTPTDLARTTFNGDDWFNLVINVSATGISIAATDLTDPATQASLSYVYGTVSGGASTAPALTTVGMYTFDSDFASRWDNLTVNQAASFQYILQTEAFLSDLDGSETLGTITLSSIPNGVTLFDTVTNTEVVVTSGSANVIVGNDIRLTSTTVLTAAQISAITATASSVESSNGNTATSQSIPVYLEITGNSPAETITGTASSDWITGDSGNDILSGGNGSDVIIGGLGNDTITTGSGSDQIVLLKGQGGATAGAAPTDIITDFTVNTDTIVIKGTNIIGVSVSTPSSNIYTITVTYSGAATEYFKVNLSNGAVLNDSGDTQLTGVVLSGGTATIDGTIVGAILYLDINNNNQEDEGERLGITDQYGHVEWVLDLAKLDVNGDGQYVLGEARAVQTGGFDIDTGLTYEINLFGPVGSAIVSPLTSLLQAQLESGFDYQTANANIVARLGLPEGTELISLNPIMGSHDILMQNASVMTAAVQFAELAAIRYSTDEGRVSFSVFEAISKALLELPEGVIADFSDTNLLNSIASYLDLGELASAEVIDFLAASQRALHVSMETLAPGDNALAAISEVQHLTQGSYAQILESYSRGYLPSHILSDISVIVLAFSSSSISYDALRDFNDQFTAVVNQSSTYYSEYSADGTQDNGTSNFVQQLDTVVHDFMTAHGLDAAQVNDFYVYTLLDLGLETENVLFPDISQSNDNTTQYSSSSTGTEELYGSANNDFIYGGYGNELIFGGDGDDFLHGGAGDDTIVGGLGNDIIHGGMGNDLMTGGGGNDVFVFEKSDIGSQPGIDTITDFKLGIEETINGEKSILDLTDLFKDSTLTSNSLDSLLQISTILNESTNQTDTVIKTDPTGNALFNASPETIVLSGVDVVSVFGTSDSAELVQHMLAANVLVMGH